MSALRNTIKLLENVINDPNCGRMNLSTVKGFLGELLVKEKLGKEGKKVEHKGNQSGYDLEFDNIKIDVKFSALKREVAYLPECWGWALKHASKKKPINFTHFICVAATRDNHSIDAFYVIKASDIKKFPRGSGQFKSVKNAFSVLPNQILPEFENPDWEKQFKISLELLKNGTVKKVKLNQKLIKYLQSPRA